jgi:DNA-binding CsgD family transcriptional regulator
VSDNSVVIDGKAVRLTPRHLQILQLLCDGAGRKEIAASLGVGVYKCDYHCRATYKKIGARNSRDAVAIALRNGMVPLNNGH